MSDEERRRTRISSKIDRLPQSVKAHVDGMLSDNMDSYQDISDWLKEEGHDISRGAVGRYALRRNKVAQRLAESLEQTKLILEHLERNPDADVSKAAQAVMSEGLMQRIATADEEFLEMPLDKAGRLLASSRRVNVAEKKLSFEMRKKIDLAFEGLEADIMKAIQNDPAIGPKLHTLLIEAREKLSADD